MSDRPLLQIVDERYPALIEQVNALKGRGGDGTSGGVTDDWKASVDRQLERLNADTRTLLDIVRDLPTKRDLSTFRWQWVATSVAAIALIVGGIIGGLGWIKPDTSAAAPAAPIVIQVPATQPPMVPTKSR